MRLPSGSVKYAAKPMSPTGIRASATMPPSFSISWSLASMSSVSMVMIGAVNRPSRRIIPPLIAPGSVGPLSPLGVVLTSV
jgi:hypothetical protein